MSRARNAEITAAKETIKSLQLKLEKQYAHLRYLQSHSPIEITDHAIVRYLQRVCAVDFEAIRKALVTPQLLELHKKFGDGEFPVDGTNLRVVIKGNSIVTVIN